MPSLQSIEFIPVAAREQRQRRGKKRDDHEDGLRTAHHEKVTTVRLI